MYDGATAAAEAVALAVAPHRAPARARGAVRAPAHPRRRGDLRGGARLHGRGRRARGRADRPRRPARGARGRRRLPAPAAAQLPRLPGGRAGPGRGGARGGRAGGRRGRPDVARPARGAGRATARTCAWGRGRRSATTRASAGPRSASSPATEELIRRMPGRIVGETTSTRTGAAASCSRCRRASSTSAARRRPRTSARTRRLNALAGIVYLSCSGQQGLRRARPPVPQPRASYARQRLADRRRRAWPSPRRLQGVRGARRPRTRATSMRACRDRGVPPGLPRSAAPTPELDDVPARRGDRAAHRRPRSTAWRCALAEVVG